MERAFSSKLAVGRQIYLHSGSSNSRRSIVSRNSKISLFRKNQLSSRVSILTLFSHETTADDYFPEKRLKTSI